MNKIIISGNLGKDNELKQTSSGTTILNNSLAVRRSRKNPQGEYDTDWFNITLFGKSAEVFSQYTGKGSKVSIVGHIEFREYQNQQGQMVNTHNVIVSEFEFLDSRNNQQHNQQPQYQNNAQNNQNTAFNNQSNVNGQLNNQNSQNNQFGGNMPIQGGTDIEVSQSDLPF